MQVRSAMVTSHGLRLSGDRGESCRVRATVSSMAAAHCSACPGLGELP